MTDPIAALAEQYATHFKERLGRPRTIGRELEFPVVKADGTAGDVRHLWPHLMAGGDLTPKYDDPESRSLIVALQGRAASYEIEVGHGTVEVVVGPCEDLVQLQAVTVKAVARLVRAAAAEGLSVLGFGIQPRTPRSTALMTPKKRYGALLKAIGAAWLHFATTAADQVQIDITRDELLPMLN
ncbi:MAG: hypothetical protein HYR71_05525, partial [Chloroflexi bacterium]|nr:hypothetical protein [Chloroflexota bacterium]